MIIEMYRIREKEVKIQVPCIKCAEKGIVDVACCKCGGKGTHNSTLKVWKVAPISVYIEGINRDKTTGDLRYWYESDSYFIESARLLHFNIEDAQFECDKRNESISPILKIHRSNCTSKNM